MPPCGRAAVSSARYTSPMPPSPSFDTILYCEIVVPIIPVSPLLLSTDGAAGLYRLRQAMFTRRTSWRDLHLFWRERSPRCLSNCEIVWGVAQKQGRDRMEYRRLGKTGFDVSEISLGTWQVGGRWGSGFDDVNAERIIEKAIDAGINFIDTADVYENRQSEAAVAKVLQRRSERIYVATKCGRFVDPQCRRGVHTGSLEGIRREDRPTRDSRHWI